MKLTGLVVEILELGLSGFAFLMVYLSFRLLKSEQGRKTVRRPMLRASYFFMIGAFLFAILVGASGIYGVMREAETNAHRVDIAECRDGLTRLTSIAKMRGQSVDSLQIAVLRFESECESVLESLDVASHN